MRKMLLMVLMVAMTSSVAFAGVVTKVTMGSDFVFVGEATENGYLVRTLEGADFINKMIAELGGSWVPFTAGRA